MSFEYRPSTLEKLFKPQDYQNQQMMEIAIQKSIQIEKIDIDDNLGFVSDKLVLVKLSKESENLKKLQIQNAVIYVGDDIPFKEFIKFNKNGKWND